MVINKLLSVTNGWTVYLNGANAYQWYQSSNKLTHILHGNLVYTNYLHPPDLGTIVWDPTISDDAVPVSLLYTNGAPSWWGTNRWPAIDPWQCWLRRSRRS